MSFLTKCVFSAFIINSTNIYKKPTYTSEEERLPTVKILHPTGGHLPTTITQTRKTSQVLTIVMKKTAQCKMIENLMGKPF